jgi:hypothetical protein
MIEETLNARHDKYGFFVDLCRTTYAIREVVNAELESRNKVLDPDQMYALDMILVKIGRIINGDPNYDDNWRDISGYATLVADRLNGRMR